MKKALVCGAGGFIGGHLVKRLKKEGYWVRGVDIKHHEFAPTQADEFLLPDLREPQNCRAALTLRQAQGRLLSGHPSAGSGQAFDEVYQLAADMGGMGFIHSAECEIMRNSALINIHMTRAAAEMGVPRYFFSSSVCVYRDMQPGEPEMTEDQGSEGAEEQGSMGELTSAPQHLSTPAPQLRGAGEGPGGHLPQGGRSGGWGDH